MTRRARTVGAVVLALVVAAAPHTSAAGRPSTVRAAPPAVVAVIGESPGVNVLHDDFRTPDGRDPVYPSGMPRPVFVSLPARGSFADRMAALQAGPLGHPQSGTLYAVHGTRLLLYATPSVTDLVGGDRLHATGVLSAAIGRRFGTAPTSLAVFIPYGVPASYAWLHDQSWIDVASTSSYTVSTVNSNDAVDTPLCLGARPVREWVARGHTFFASAGNTTDEAEPLTSPNGLAEVYQVGGVDGSGHTWLPGHLEESDPFYAAGTVVRPYQTGELYSFPAAAPDALTGSVHFGGTSGATPRTAGRAAALISAARAVISRGRPAQGPLSDGELSSTELVSLLHAVAVPVLPDSPVGYATEGYGALTAGSQDLALRVLAGTAPMPNRSLDDAANTAAQQLRAAGVDARCP